MSIASVVYTFAGNGRDHFGMAIINKTAPDPTFAAHVYLTTNILQTIASGGIAVGFGLIMVGVANRINSR